MYLLGIARVALLTTRQIHCIWLAMDFFILLHISFWILFSVSVVHLWTKDSKEYYIFIGSIHYLSLGLTMLHENVVMVDHITPMCFIVANLYELIVHVGNDLEQHRLEVVFDHFMEGPYCVYCCLVVWWSLLCMQSLDVL